MWQLANVMSLYIASSCVEWASSTLTNDCIHTIAAIHMPAADSVVLIVMIILLHLLIMCQ